METLAISSRVGKCLLLLPNHAYIFDAAHLDIIEQFGQDIVIGVYEENTSFTFAQSFLDSPDNKVISLL